VCLGGTVSIQKPKYRSELGIILDILDLLSSGGQNGIIVSVISRIANVSYNSVNERCQKLVGGGLVRSVKNRKNHRYIITENGIEFLAKLRQFTNEIKSMNIRY
jgi:predicted transcriptional regulator